MLAEAEIDEVLVEAAIIHLRGNSDGPDGALRHLKFVAHNLRAARNNRVVKRDDPRVPHLVPVIQRAFGVDQPVGEAVRGRIELAVGPEAAGVDQSMAGGVSGFKLHPALVEIALFWNKVVPDPLVLDHD